MHNTFRLVHDGLPARADWSCELWRAASRANQQHARFQAYPRRKEYEMSKSCQDQEATNSNGIVSQRGAVEIKPETFHKNGLRNAIMGALPWEITKINY